jgi:pentatricopeptide repeat protein
MKRESLLYDASVVIGNVGRVYVEQGDYDMALYMYEETLMVRGFIQHAL